MIKYYWKKEHRQNKWTLYYSDYYGDHRTWLTVQSAPWFEMYFGDSYYGRVPKKLLLQELNLPTYEEIWSESHTGPLSKQERIHRCAKWKKKILKAVTKLSKNFER